MLHLPPLSQILDHAFGPAPADRADTTRNDQTQQPTAATSAPVGHMAALLQMEDAVGSTHVQAAAQQRQQDLRNRARADLLLARLQAGGGVAAFCAQDPTGQHFCYRHENNVLVVARHAAFLAGQEPAFVLHMHGAGLMARQDGAWIENPDAAFFEALDAACRSAQQAFIS